MVVRSEVICLSGIHRHRHIVEVERDDGSGRDIYNTEEDYDDTTHLMRKKEWEALQQGGEEEI